MNLNFNLNMTPTLETLPLRIKNNVDTSSLYLSNAFPVAVQYWVLRPKKKDNS